MSKQAVRSQKSQQKSQQKTQTTLDAQKVTNETSVQLLDALLQVSVGCITYLRGIFADALYEDDVVTISEVKQTSSKNVRIKKLRRGRDPEADKLLDWIEKGVRDALHRQYLKTLMLAIYADPEKPNDIIECYSFNFSYAKHSVATKAGGVEQIAIPSLAITDEMRNLGIADAAKLDSKKVYTVHEVKSQIQQLVKRLIMMTQTLHDLPRRRWVSMKLFYYEHTPADYEPPCFEAASDKSSFTMSTGDQNLQPERIGIGKVETGHHKLNVNLVTVAQAVGGTDAIAEPTLERQIAHNRAEAEERRIVWDAEEPARADSDTEEGMMQVDHAGAYSQKPLGQRDADSSVILPLPPVDIDEMAVDETDEADLGGGSLRLSYAETVDPAAALASGDGGDREMLEHHGIDPSQISSTEEEGIETPRASQNQGLGETVASAHPHEDADDPIDGASQSFTGKVEGDAGKASQEQLAPIPAGPRSHVCDCGDSDDDGEMVWCDHCQIWLHANCCAQIFDSSDNTHARSDGYPDPMQPPYDNFYCYACRGRQAVPFPRDTQREGEMEAGLEELRTLAIYRRTLHHVFSRDSVPLASDLAKKLLKCTLPVASELINRLKEEGLIYDENKAATETQNTLGLLASETQSRKKPSKRHLKPKLVPTQDYNMLKSRNDRYFTAENGEERSIWLRMGLVPRNGRVAPVFDTPGLAPPARRRSRQPTPQSERTSPSKEATAESTHTSVHPIDLHHDEFQSSRINKRQRSLDNQVDSNATPPASANENKRQKVSLAREQLTTLDEEVD